MGFAAEVLTLRNMVDRWDEYFPEIETYPERKLWCAVILTAFHEYEMCLQKIDDIWKRTLRPINRTYLMELRSVRSELSSEWFLEVCDFAEVDISHINRKLNNLDKQYGLHGVQFSERASVIKRIRNSSKGRLIRE